MIRRRRAAASAFALALAFAIVSAVSTACIPPPGADAVPLAPPPPAPTLEAPRDPSPPSRGPAPAPIVVASQDPEQHFADLGACELDSGAQIAPCRVGYRTYGTLDANKSNVVLVPTWFTGTTKSLTSIVPDKLVDTKRFYLVLVDALGDGVSSSPSNSRTQPRLAFPRFTIGDMVESQRRLLTEVMGIERVRAVLGISMGGMQAYEWAVRHPAMVERVVPIVGTPRLTSSDLLLWTTELRALQHDVGFRGGDYEGRPSLRTVLDVHLAAMTTPAHRAEATSPEDFTTWLRGEEDAFTFDWNDWHRQLEAMLAHDVSKPYGSLEAAAKRVTARGLYVVAEQDHAVNPAFAKTFARAHAGSNLVVLPSPCGHFALGCEQAKVARVVRAFLAAE